MKNATKKLKVADNVTETQTSYVAGTDAPMRYAMCMTHVPLHTS